MGKRAPKNKQSKPTSTAAIFKDVDGLEDPKLRKYETLEKKVEESKEIEEDDGEDDPWSHKFPFNYIYATQDYLNDNLTVNKSIEVLVLAYIVQLTYIYLPELMAKYRETVFMNLCGVAIGLVFSYNLTWKKHLEGVGPEPKVPEFNTLYAVVLPTLYFLKNDFHLIENLTFNYFIVENLPIVMQGASALSFYFLYSPDDAINEYVKKFIFFILMKYLLEFINQGDEEHDISKEVVEQDIDYDYVEIKDNKIKSGLNKSFSKTEIHLILVVLVNLIFNLETKNLNIIIFQKLLVSLLVSCVLVYPVFKGSKFASVPIFSAGFYYLTNYQLEPVLKENSLVYLYDLVHQGNNLQLFSTWVAVLLINILLIFNVNIAFNLRRKVWHFIILGTILPSVVIDKSFTILGLLGLLIILILIEIVRANKISFIGEFIYDKLYRFQDFKDLKGPLNLSYIYLVMGVASPLVLHELISPNPEEVDLKQFLGLISLGLGDSFASIIGQKFGSHYYPGSKKTLEGSLAFFVINLACFKGLAIYFGIEKFDWEAILVTNLIGSLLEGVVTLNDNLFLPPVLYILWEVLESSK